MYILFYDNLLLDNFCLWTMLPKASLVNLLLYVLFIAFVLPIQRIHCSVTVFIAVLRFSETVVRTLCTENVASLVN